MKNQCLFGRWSYGALLACCVVLVGCATGGTASAPSANAAVNEIAVHFISVGQGDCTLIVFPSGKRLLVDCGSTNGPFDPAAIRTYIQQNLASTNPKIDLLLITHPDQDHYNKIPIVLGSPDMPVIAVDKVMFVGEPEEYDSADFDEWLNKMPATRRIAVTDQRYNVYPPLGLPGFESDGVMVLAANVKASYSPSNARSIVLKISHGQFDVMITGDATRATDSAILENFKNHLGELDVEVWKAAHHGSSATATQDSKWADAVKPETVVYSASATNTYGHPNRKLADKFKSYTTSVATHSIMLWEGPGNPTNATTTQTYETEAMYLTATNGNIVIKSTGPTFQTTLERN